MKANLLHSPLCAALYAHYKNHAVLVPKMFVSVVYLLCLNESRNVFVILSQVPVTLTLSALIPLSPPPPAPEVRGQMDQVIGSRHHLRSLTYSGQHCVQVYPKPFIFKVPLT